VDTPLFVNRGQGAPLPLEWIGPPAPRSAPLVVCLGEWDEGDDRSASRRLASRLAQEGIGTLRFAPARHRGRDRTPACDAFQQEVDDLVDVVAGLHRLRAPASFGIAAADASASVAVAATARGPGIAALVVRAPSGIAASVAVPGIGVPTLVIQDAPDPPFDTGGGSRLDEPTRSEAATARAVDWFKRHLVAVAPEGGATAAATRFVDRSAAGRALAARLGHLASKQPLVLALPRGGLVVAEPIARALDAELDVLVARKVRTPDCSQLAMGAVAEGGVVEWDQRIVRRLEIPAAACRAALETASRELTEQVAELRLGRPPVEVAGRCVVLVDDGIATGATMKAAIAALAGRGVARLVVAVPCGTSEALDEVAAAGGVDELVALSRPEPFFAIGLQYDDFAQLSTDAACDVLERHRERRRRKSAADRRYGEAFP